ncbi:MAG TPA: hypothetical protein DHW07_01705 [Gammaproteobacteria bacterium]|nr:hypothetical protein [Gammaproteobacteria bacterium]
MQSPRTNHHRTLTPAELAHYRQHGYVAIEAFFPADELLALDQHLDRFAAGEDRSAFAHQGQDARGWIMRLGLATPQTAAFCADERVLDLITPIVQPGIAIYSAKMVAKEPHDPTICHWHQDDAYYQQTSHSDCRMSIWLPLTDCDETNGCLWTVPGSHKQGLQEWTKRAFGFCNLAFEDGLAQLDGAIPVRIAAGDILLFHALTWHRSLSNQTDHTRRSFIVSYQDAEAIKGNGPQHKILRAA